MAQLRDSLITGDLRVTGIIYGNATSADKLKTARTIGISGGATGTATSFDGTQNITIPITALDMSKANAGTLPVGRGGTGATTFTSGNLLVGNGTGAITTIAKTNANTANTVVQRDGSGNFSANIITANRLQLQKADDGIYYQGTKANYRMIRMLDNTGDTYGNGIGIGGGGIVVIGSGEYTDSLISAKSLGGGEETTYIGSDSSIYLESNGQDIANRIGIQIDTGGHIIPVKVESGNNNAQNLGSSSYKWANVYATTFNGNATSATQFASNQSITLTGDTTGTATSKAGWSIATTTTKLGSTKSLTSSDDENTIFGSNKIQLYLHSNSNRPANCPSSSYNSGLIILPTSRGSNDTFQLEYSCNTGDLYTRSWLTGDSVTNFPEWKTILNSGNYTTYTVKKDGTGASGTWGISISGNASTATGFASAKTIALTGNVTGSATGGNGSNGWSIATTIGSGVVTNAMLAGSIANGKLVNSSMTIAGNSISLGGSLAADTLRTSLGLSSAMHFLGITTTAMSDGLTTAAITIDGNSKTPAAGDVVIDNSSAYEYVWSGSKWERLGPDGSYSLSDHVHGNITNGGLLGTASVAVVTDANKKITTANLATSDPNASGSGITYIASISQNGQGKITATKSTVRDASASQSGVVSTGAQTFAGAKTFNALITAQGSQYGDSYSGALNMNNSNIYGLNAIYTADTADNAAEGINFYRDSTHVDTLWINGGNLLFVPNRALGTGTSAADSQKVGRFTVNPTSGQFVITDGTTGGMKSSGYSASSFAAASHGTHVTYGTSTSAVSTTAAAGTASTVSRSDHVHSITLATGDNNGQVKIAGTNVSVKGLGSNAYSSIEYTPLIYMPWRTKRDFVNGTLITTSLSGGTTNSSIPFLLIIKGNGYGDGFVECHAQGYVYNLGNGYTQYINTNAFSTRNFADKIYAYKNTDGYLCFWFARMVYWQGFDITVYNCNDPGDNNRHQLINYVTNVTDAALPEDANRQYTTEISVQKNIHSGNYTTYTVKKDGTGASGNWGISITGSSGSCTGNAATATTLQTTRTLWGQNFNGSVNVSGSMTNVGPQLKLPSSQTAFEFLTSGSGAAIGKFSKLLLSDNYSQGDITNYRLYVNNGKSYFNGDAYINGNLYFPNTNHIIWNSGSWYQRILVTDDSNANTSVFQFQQSSNSGSSYTDLLTIRDNGKLILTDNTGGIYKYHGTANTDPVIQVNSNNLDTVILRIDGDNPTGVRDSQAYGFNLKYIGTGGGEANSLDLIADNMGGTDVTAISISNNGKIGIGAKYNTNYKLYVNGVSYIQANSSNSASVGFTLNNGYLNITNYGQTLSIGAQNTSWTHIQTTGSQFYINKGTAVDGNLWPYSNNTRTLGTSSYKWANVYATTFNGSLDGNAATATKATQDSDGNQINNTYIKKSIGTTKGDIIYWSAANTPARLGVGSNGQVLKVVNGAPAWSSDTDTDTKVTNTVKTTTKFYVTGTESSTTNTGTQDFDTGIYATTTAGQLNATTYKINEAIILQYNATTQCLEYVFA